jgi:hypothetical protein
LTPPQLWIIGAVGIIGNGSHPANLMYIGVLGTAVFGALAARFRARALSIAMFGTALAQSLVTVIALIVTKGTPAGDPVKMIALNGFFVALWLVSAGLFRKAAERQSTSPRV